MDVLGAYHTFMSSVSVLLRNCSLYRSMAALGSVEITRCDLDRCNADPRLIGTALLHGHFCTWRSVVKESYFDLAMYNEVTALLWVGVRSSDFDHRNTERSC